MSQDITADALNRIMNAQKAGKKILELRYFSKIVISILAIAKLHGYIKHYTVEDKTLKIELENIKGCSAIKPRFTVTIEEIEKYAQRFLPAKNMGIMILSTSQGLMNHRTALDKKIGGSLIAYIY